MYLSADIVFDHLPESFGARLDGPREIGLTLHRPLLCEGNEAKFSSGRLYLVHADRLPSRMHAEKGAVIVSVGNSAQLAHYQQRCCVITLPREADFFHAFNALQTIFDQFDRWEADLQAIIEQDSDISRMLTRSEPIFDNALYAIDEDFRILGASPLAQLENGSMLATDDGVSLSLDSFDQFLELHDLSMDEREPMLLNLLDQSTLNYNLHEDDRYRGCLTVHYIQRPYRASDKPLIAFLGNMVLRAERQLSSRNAGSHRSMALALQSLVEGVPVDATSRQILEGGTSGRGYACLRLKLSSKLEQLPLGYVGKTLEDSLPGSTVFEYHRNSVVAIVDLDRLASDDCPTAIKDAIEPFTGTMGMKAGLSEVYHDLLYTHYMFRQANTALDLGMLFEPDESVFVFHDYALREIIMKATDELPLDLLMPTGLHKLVEHDKVSETSYVETLRTYLNNNMSVSKTAAALYVHRSTLMERLARIKRELGLDLDDTDAQLYLRILLKAIDLHETLVARAGEQQRPGEPGR